MYTIGDLKALQALPLERKIFITQTRIIEWYQKFKGQVYVSFSGGKDSTVLLHIARQLYPKQAFMVKFVVLIELEFYIVVFYVIQGVNTVQLGAIGQAVYSVASARTSKKVKVVSNA